MHTPLKLLGIACAAWLCCSCHRSGQTEENRYSEYEKPDTSSSVQAMKDYHYSAKVKVGNTEYAYDIVREANDTLPSVEGDGNEKYADNYIRLRINRENRQIFNHVFTKNSFKNYVDDKFLSTSILEGMAFDRVTDGTLRFSASVSYPASDIYVPLSITVSPDGCYTISKDEVLDTETDNDSVAHD
ncbi:MAG: DUF4738 domain-containing protein [Paraprevotella sp.]|nr:DUF4738 domain-containing protein [Paraprevotella sp.]